MHRMEYREFCKFPEFLLKEIEDMSEARERAVRYMNSGAHRCFEHRHAAHQVWNHMSAGKQLDMLEQSAKEHEKMVHVLNALHGRLDKEKSRALKGVRCPRS